MQPTYQAGTVVVGVSPRRIRPGDIVVIWHEGLDKIKRVKHIDVDKIFVTGDNPHESTDSRHFGWVPTDTVVAKIVWPRPQRMALPTAE